MEFDCYLQKENYYFRFRTGSIIVRDGKISLSIKALSDNGRKSDDSAPRAGRPERVKIPKAEKIGTSLGDLMKDIKL